MHPCERLFGINRSVEIHKLILAATGRECSCAGGSGPPCVAGAAAQRLIDQGRARLEVVVAEAYRP